MKGIDANNQEETQVAEQIENSFNNLSEVHKQIEDNDEYKRYVKEHPI